MSCARIIGADDHTGARNDREPRSPFRRAWRLPPHNEIGQGMVARPSNYENRRLAAILLPPNPSFELPRAKIHAHSLWTIGSEVSTIREVGQHLHLFCGAKDSVALNPEWSAGHDRAIQHILVIPAKNRALTANLVKPLIDIMPDTVENR